MLTKKETQQSLSKLCVKLGFCDADESFLELKLDTVDEFTRAVIRADGLNLDERSDMYKQIRQVVDEAFQKHFDSEDNNCMRLQL